MPDPRPGESKQDYIKRCIPEVIRDGAAKDGAQANAICNRMWEDAMGESNGRRIIEKGQRLEELVKGSLDYTRYLIRRAFREQFPADDGTTYFWVEEIFSDHVIVSDGSLKADEYYHVPYQREGEQITFAPRADWEVVQLAYVPQTQALAETAATRKAEATKLVEAMGHLIPLDESELARNPDGPWRIQAVGLTVDEVNANGRIYRAPQALSAVREVSSHLNESAGQGRAMYLLGEGEHPSMKATRRPFLPEVVTNWTRIDFDGRHILLEGLLLGTAKGKDIRAQMLGGVMPGVSQRAYGETRTVEVDGNEAEEVTWFTITGYDLTVEPSDVSAGITMYESTDSEPNTRPSLKESTMDEITLELLREKHPELVQAIIEEADQKKRKALEEELQRRADKEKELQKFLAEREATMRQQLGLGDTDDLLTAIQERNAELTRLQIAENKRKVAAYIADEVAKLKYPEWMRQQLAEAITKAEPATVEEARDLIIARRPEYDAIISKLKMREMGHAHGLEVLGPVLESELGVPEYARAAFEITESLLRVAPDGGVRRDFNSPKNVNERFTAEYLRAFDEQNRRALMAEAKAFAEAEASTDLNLPTSVLRAVIAEAFPQLIATSIFDFGMIGTSPTLLYFEAYAGETGAENVQVTDESITSDEGAWISLAHQRLEPGSVVVTSDPAGTTYVEDTDYVIDYANGKLFTLASGSIGDSTALLIDYQYYAYREGEGAEIQQGKVGLSSVTVTAKADRLATQINDEAIVFSRSQLGYDAVTKTLAALVRQIRRRIDEGILRLALAQVKTVASNSGGTWTAASDTIEDLVEKIGAAKVLVGNRYYQPTAVACSLTNSDRISNWDGFSAAGSRPDAMLNPNGFTGRIKGLDAFETTEMPDGYILVVNRELVMHRVYQTLRLKGPFHTVGSNNKLIAAEQYFVEEYNLTEAPVPQKGSYIKIA